MHTCAGSRLYFDFLHQNQFERWRNFDGAHTVSKVRRTSPYVVFVSLMCFHKKPSRRRCDLLQHATQKCAPCCDIQGSPVPCCILSSAYSAERGACHLDQHT